MTIEALFSGPILRARPVLMHLGHKNLTDGWDLSPWLKQGVVSIKVKRGTQTLALCYCDCAFPHDGYFFLSISFLPSLLPFGLVFWWMYTFDVLFSNEKLCL